MFFAEKGVLGRSCAQIIVFPKDYQGFWVPRMCEIGQKWWNFQLFGCVKPKKTLLFSRSIFWLWILMDMTAFPGPIFKSRIIFGNNFSSQFQIWSQNFKGSIFGVRKSWKTLLFRRLINVCSYWWIWLLSQVQFSKVGPFSEVIFQANFRFAVEISNFQLFGRVKAEKLSFLEG